MKTKAVSTRRLFFWKAGVALSAPLAVATASPSPRVSDGEAQKARLAELEDVNAIRELQQTYARLVNAGAHDEVARLFADPSQARVDEHIRSLSADRFGEDVIEVTSDHKTAAARMHCTVHTETPIEPSCPLVEMARLQGEGVLKRSEKRVLENVYVRRGGVWKIARSEFRNPCERRIEMKS